MQKETHPTMGYRIGGTRAVNFRAYAVPENETEEQRKQRERDSEKARKLEVRKATLKARIQAK